MTSLGNPTLGWTEPPLEILDAVVDMPVVHAPPIEPSLPSYEENEAYINPRRFRRIDKFTGGGIY